MRHVRLQVPQPAEPSRLDRFLTAQLPELGPTRIRMLLGERKVRVGGRVEVRGERTLRPREWVELSYHPSLLPPPDRWGRDRLLLEGPGFFAVDKPEGVLTHRDEIHGIGVAELLGPVVGLAPALLKPAHRLDRETSGVLLVAEDRDTARELSSLFADREIAKQYRAIVSPAPERDQDSVQRHDEAGRPMTLRWQVLRRSPNGARAELLVEPREGRTHQIRLLLAAAGFPIVGDVEHGRALPGGAPRMGLHCWRLRWDDVEVEAPLPRGWDRLLDEPKALAPPPGTPPPAQRKDGGRPQPTGRRTLRVSAATRRVLGAGHPWVVADRDTGDMSALRAGDVVDLVDPGGFFVATATVDPGQPVCARVLGVDPQEPLGEQSWEHRAGAALERRAALLADGETDAIRLVHGEADGLPGLTVDRWGPLLVATVAGPCAEVFLPGVLAAVEARVGRVPVWQQRHFTDLRRKGGTGARLDGAWRVPPDGDLPASLWVRERGLRFLVEPRGTLSTGLYPDQRDNRARLAPSFPGARVLNLFGHTGAWTVAALAAGAEHACTVDLARGWLQRAGENVAANGLPENRHRAVAQGALEFVRGDDGGWDVAIVDPPAFAKGRSGDPDWSARRDLPGLLAALVPRLSAKGRALVTVNAKDLAETWLRDAITLAWRHGGRPSPRLRRMEPSMDYPVRKGFPEGRAFVGLLVEPGSEHG
jgi:23S rRNA (cytosine1962-C5)-methyltransferase